MESIPSEMAEVLKRTSYHPIFNEVLDFSTALLDAEGQLIASSMGVARPPGRTGAEREGDHRPFRRRRARPGRRAHPQQPVPGRHSSARRGRAGSRLPPGRAGGLLRGSGTPRRHRRHAPGQLRRRHHQHLPGRGAAAPHQALRPGHSERGGQGPLPGQRARAPFQLGRPPGPGGRMPSGREAPPGVCSRSTVPRP